MTECGTLKAYNLHRKRGEPTCQACRDAANQAQREYRHNGPIAPVELPRMGPDTFSEVPCFVEGPFLWESQHDTESVKDVRTRWRTAARLCRTQCPAFNECEQLADAQHVTDGVWAGRVPRARGERR